METFIADLLSKNNCAIEESVFYKSGNIEFWQSTVCDKLRTPISGGFSDNKLQARKIAVAEFLERQACAELSTADEQIRKNWGFDLIPTACGFAAGFNMTNTILRSINEAAERWVMSKWIDEHFWIESISCEDVKKKLNSTSLFFVSQFKEVLFFKKDIVIFLNNQVLKITIAQTIGLTENGIFPGSSAQSTGGNVWQHALLESFRHLLAIKNNPDRVNIFPDNKVRFFGKNRDVALEQIKIAKRKDWPIPEVKLHNSKSYLNDNYFIARTILSGWKSWHHGPIERFLY